MKTPDRRKTARCLEEEYRFSLQVYVADRTEAALGKAYELGRMALAERKGLVDLIFVHHQALRSLLKQDGPGKDAKELLRAGGEFLAECLSPYEMTHRGFQDAVKALRQLNETLEQEIKRIAYAVHDEAGQLLVAVHLALAELARELPPPQRDRIGHVGELLKEIENQLRRYSHELRPTILDDLGWIPAIRFLADGISKRTNLAIHIEAPLDGRPPGSSETALYRIVQEALTNAAKHAQANCVRIRAWREKSFLCCSIRDDGVGMDLQKHQAGYARKGLGLVAMQERVSALGGTLQIDSQLGQGTEISIRIPMEERHGNSYRSG
jgi:signal transduction histidine kinase